MPSIIPYLGQAAANAGAGTLGYLGSVLPSQYQSGFDSTANNLGEAGNAFGIYNGLSSGQPMGYLSAATNAAQLGARSGLFNPQTSSTLGTATNDLGSLMGMYSGIQQGGFAGDTQAGLNAARLATNAGYLGGPTGALGSALPYATLPLDAYQFATQDTQSGRSGSDAMGGAMTGAEAGAAFGPIGMGVGALVGGALGGIASAFGPGAEDPENTQWNNYAAAYAKNPQIGNYLTPAQAYQNLSGEMDARTNAPGHSQPIEQVFGRMGEQNLMDQLTSYLNQEYQSGALTPNETISQQWNSIINPWLQSKGAGIANQRTITGAPEAAPLTNDLQTLVNDWETGWLQPTSPVGINGQTIAGLKPYLGETPFNHTIVNNYNSQQAADAQATDQQRLAQQMQQNHVHTGFADGGSMNKRHFPTYRQVKDHVHKVKVRKFGSGGSFNTGTTGTGFDIPSGNLNWGSSTFSSPSNTGELGTSTFSSPSNTGDLSGLTGGNIPSGNLNWGGTPQYNPAVANPFGYTSANPYAGTSSTNSSSPGWLSKIESALGSGGKDISGLLNAAKGYLPLLPLLGALTGATNPPQASIQSVQGTQTQSIPTVAIPGVNRTYTPPNLSQQQWYTYGEGPEASFYQNNATPQVQGMQPGQVPGAAEGGHLQMFASGSGDHYVQGPGDGTSDDIPAKLSDGEYVMDAGTVSMLGNGSNQAGARKLDQLRKKIRMEAGRKLVKGKQFMKSKSPEQYLKGGKE